MSSLDEFLPLIRGRLPGAPDIILKDAVRDACIEFCRRAQVLTATADLTVTANDATPTLSFDDGDVWSVQDLRRGTSALLPSNQREFQVRGWDATTGAPQAYYLDGSGLLVLGPIPDAEETLSITVTLCPFADATEVDDALYRDHRETIAAGARAYVRRNFGDWVNPQLEAEDRKLFEYAIHNQNIRRARGAANTALRVRATPF